MKTELETKKEVAEKVIPLLKEYDFVDFCVDDEGAGWVEIDGDTFHFESNGEIIRTDISL